MRRVLVVAYYFPPSGGPGVQRVLKAVKYLRDFGYEPTVLTVADGAFPQRDEGLAADVPAGVRVVRTRSLDPFGLYARATGRAAGEAVPVGSVGQGGGMAERVARWARANVFLPDARVGWVPFAVRAGLRLHRQRPFASQPPAGRFDVVLTSGPPHSAHLIGRALRRRTGVAWAADFRDPWTGINFYDELPMTRPARRLDEALERSVLREADRLLTVSPTWQHALAEKARRPLADVAVVHNGYDPEDFFAAEGTEPTADRFSSEPHSARFQESRAARFTLAHIGSLYGSRNPEALWAALARLRQSGGVERLAVRLVGAVDDGVRQSLAAHGLDGVVEIVPYVPHAEAVRQMRQATALLLVVEGFGLARGMITGKLYEYLAAGRPVVGLGPPDGDAAVLLEETGAGRMLDRADADGLAAHVGALYAAWARGEALAGAAPEAAARYTRRAQTGLLAAALDDAVGARRTR